MATNSKCLPSFPYFPMSHFQVASSILLKCTLVLYENCSLDVANVAKLSSGSAEAKTAHGIHFVILPKINFIFYF